MPQRPKNAGRRSTKTENAAINPNALLSPEFAEQRIHLLREGFVCDTEPRGYATPSGRSLTEIVINVSEGVIPLWAPNVTLRWRFRHPYSPETRGIVRSLLADALMAWGNAAPISFTEDTDVWDFEIVLLSTDNCVANGCVLASAFFPDAGRHQLLIYPMLFSQDHQEQVETLVHEVGHIFGLRHFFAQISEKEWPSQIFGTHDKFSIMNYGSLSALTAADKQDLRRLYEAAWSGALTHINGTPIKKVRPFHEAIASEEKRFDGAASYLLNPGVTYSTLGSEASASVTLTRQEVLVACCIAISEVSNAIPGKIRESDNLSTFVPVAVKANLVVAVHRHFTFVDTTDLFNALYGEVGKVSALVDFVFDAQSREG